MRQLLHPCLLVHLRVKYLRKRFLIADFSSMKMYITVRSQFLFVKLHNTFSSLKIQIKSHLHLKGNMNKPDTLNTSLMLPNGIKS